MTKRFRVVFLGALAMTACTSGSKATVGSTFNDPPSYPGPKWTLNGQQVAPEVVVSAAGPNHCDWQSATFLTIGWPLGTAAQNATEARQYIRDPKATVPSSSLRATLDEHATLPPDARPTGFTVNGIQLYLAPSDQDQAAYVVDGSNIERWPRSDPMTVCS